MKYSPLFKLECVKKHKNGERGFRPDGKGRSESFMKQVGLWAKHYDKFGMDGLRHSGRQRNWTAEERFVLVCKVLSGLSLPSVAAEPRNQGNVASHKKVRRLMAKMGLAAISRKRKYKSCFGEAGRIAKNVIAGDFKADGPNKKRATDASQFACPFGKCCLCPIIDTGSGGVVSRGLSMPPSLERTMRMPDAAFAKHKDLKGLILHGGMGWQYQHDLCRKRLEEKGIVQSMSRKGSCIDSCIMESFFGAMKNETFYGHEAECRTFEEFKKAVPNTSTTTTAGGSSRKQNGCPRPNTGRHPR